MDEALAANNLEAEMALTIEAVFEAFLIRAGNNIVDNLGLTDGLVGHVANVATAQFNVVAERRQMDVKRHDFETTFIIFLLTENTTRLQKYDWRSHQNKHQNYENYDNKCCH